MSDINSYNLSRQFFDFSFENPELIKPNHGILYFFIIEHCNRLGWKSKFGLPTTMAMEAIGIKSYNTYRDALNDLIDWGFIKMIERSKNQYSANIVAISNFNKASTKALDKALIKHDTKQSIKQSESTLQSIDSIDKQETINKEQINNIYRSFKHLKISFKEFDKLILDGFLKTEIDDILDAVENNAKNKNYISLYLTAKKWLKNNKEKNSGQKESKFEQIINQHDRLNRKFDSERQ